MVRLFNVIYELQSKRGRPIGGITIQDPTEINLSAPSKQSQPSIGGAGIATKLKQGEKKVMESSSSKPKTRRPRTQSHTAAIDGAYSSSRTVAHEEASTVASGGSSTIEAIDLNPHIHLIQSEGATK